jgi:peptidoglycan/LPS O-acetylase OafA/YrhL
MSHASRPSDAPADFRLGHRRWLDGLRGVAVLLVLAYHLRLVPGGFLGVDVFFVLSGFLITTLLVEEWRDRGSVSLRRFYLRRFLRLTPALAVLLLGCLLYTTCFRPPTEAAAYRREMAVAACYVSNWPTVHGVPMGTLGHTWSLSVEEQFYLLWPLLLVGLLRLGVGPRGLAAVAAAGALASAGLRLALHRLHRAGAPHPFEADLQHMTRVYSGLDTRADALLVGCLVGVLAAANLLPRSRRFVRWTGLASVAAVAALGSFVLTRSLGRSYPQLFDGLFTVFALAVGVVLVRLVSAPSRVGSAVLGAAPLVWVGRLSYGLYLFHIPFILWCCPALGDGDRPAPADTLLILALTFAAAAVSYYAVERPCLRLKDRLRPRALPPADAPAASGAGGPTPVSRAARPSPTPAPSGPPAPAAPSRTAGSPGPSWRRTRTPSPTP